MSEKPLSRVPWHLWVVGVLSLLWNAIGAHDYLMTQTQNEAYMSQFSAAELDYFYGFPAWAVAFWAIAVWGSVVGSVLLLLRKRLAVPVFLAVIVSVTITTIYNWLLSNGLEIMGDAFSIIFTLVIIIISVLLYVYAKRQEAAGVLQ